MRLATCSAGAGPTLGVLHGFTQTAQSMPDLVRALARDRHVVCVDLPGHGRSAALRADLWGAAELVGEAVGAADYLGYSLGGRVLLHLALARPDLVRSMVLIGATAGIDGDAERAARRRADEELASALDPPAGVVDDPSRQALRLESFLDRWLQGPLFARLSPEAASRGSRLANTADGLASSLRLAGAGTQEPLWQRLGEARMPALVIAGAEDEKFAALARRLVQHLPDARLELVPGAGHAAHLEAPQAVAAAVSRFLGARPH